MSLTFGRAPFGGQRGVFSFGSAPDHVTYVEDWPRRMRAVIGGRAVLDSSRGKLVHETATFPMLYFPLDDFSQDVLVPGEHSRSWALKVGDRLLEGAVRTAETGDDPVASALRGMVTLDNTVVDRWFEEDDPIYAHFRDPYHRVDVRSSSRHVVVRSGSVVVAESHRPKLLFETSTPIRYYLPFADVRLDLLQLSDTVSECPYKGDGQHWHLVTGTGRIDDAAWSLPHPLPEGFPAAEHICFYPDKVDVEVDGQLLTPSHA